MKIAIILFFLLTFLSFGCCLSNGERTFFGEITDTVRVDNKNWWYISTECSKFRKGSPFYETDIVIGNFEYHGFSTFQNESFVICNFGKLTDCDTVFRFESTEAYPINKLSKAFLLNEENGEYYFLHQEIGGASHSEYTDLTVWCLSKKEGIKALGYYDIHYCEFVKLFGDSTILNLVEKEVCSKYPWE